VVEEGWERAWEREDGRNVGRVILGNGIGTKEVSHGGLSDERRRHRVLTVSSGIEI
jgi:hypothetical protein